MDYAHIDNLKFKLDIFLYLQLYKNLNCVYFAERSSIDSCQRNYSFYQTVIKYSRHVRYINLVNRYSMLKANNKTLLK